MPQWDTEVGINLRLNGPGRNLYEVAQGLRAIDRAWAFSASVEAYQRGYVDSWIQQTQYAPRPSGLRVSRESPTLIEIWEATDVPAIIGATFAAFAYVVANVEKIVTIPERIQIAKSSVRVAQLELEAKLEELESGEGPVLELPVEPPALALPGEAPERYEFDRIDRQIAIAEARARLDRLEQEELLRNAASRDLRVLEERARSIKGELERAEPEIIETYGIATWRARRRRTL